MAALKIDTHHHFVPTFLRQAMTDIPHLSKGMRTPTWTPQTTLSFMASNWIETSILSCALPLAVLALEGPTKAATLTREVNDYLASLRTEHPTQLGFFASRLPSKTRKPASRKSGTPSMTSTQMALESVWAVLNARGAVVFTHPTIEGAAENCIHEPFPIHPPPLDWTHETSRAATRLSGKWEEEFLEDARRLYFDIALVGPPVTSLQLVREFAWSGYVLFGTEFPFVAAEGAARRWEGATVDGGENFMTETRNAAQVLFPRLRG
ncbi:hypothetical protein BJX65DRAFT_321819 [Aspergillus insuetus]